MKSLTVSTVSPSICHEVMGLEAMILVRVFTIPMLGERKKKNLSAVIGKVLGYLKMSGK